MNDFILNFFEQNKELFNKPFNQIDWDEIYKKAFKFGFNGPNTTAPLYYLTETMFDLFGQDKILNKLTFIPPHFLAGSHNTTSIYIPEGVTGIGDNAFTQSELEKINIPDSVDDLGFGTFSSTLNLKEISLPDSIKLIKGRCFYFSGLEKIKLSSNLETITHSAFTSTNLTNIDFPNTLTQIGDHAFSSCENLKEIDIPKNFQYLGRSAFERCYALTNVSIGEGLKIIEEGTFYNCHNLKELSLPHSIKELSTACFNDCGDITIYYNGTKEEWRKLYKPGAFKGTYFICECTDGKVIKKRK